MLDSTADFLTTDDYSAAIARYEQAIAENAEDTSAYLQLGIAWLLAGEVEVAQATWLAAMAEKETPALERLTADLLQLLMQEASRQMAVGRLDQATCLYRQAMELDVEDATVPAQLGEVLALQGELDAAVECWQMAIALNPQALELYPKLGEVLQKLGRFDEAVACYEVLLAQQPADWTTHYALARCHVQLQHWQGAIAYLQQTLQLQPEFAAAHGDLGMAWLQLGDWESAIQHLRQGVQLNLAWAENYCSWVDECLAEGAESVTRMNANLLRSLQFNTPDLYFNLGQVLAKNGNWQRAMQAYQQAIARQPEQPKFQFELGKTLVQLKQFEAAITAFQTAIQKSSKNAEWYLELGRAIAKTGNFPAALQAYQTALELDQNSAEIYLALGNLQLSQQQWQVAIVHYEKALLFQPSVEAWCNLAVALAHQNWDAEAIASFRQVLQLDSNLAPAISNIIHSLQTQEKLLPNTPGLQSILPIDPPTKCYETTQAWAIAADLENSHYVAIHPAQTVALKPPRTPDQNIHFSFRFGHEIEIPGTFVATIPQGRFWLDPDQSSSAIFTAEGELLVDLSPEFPVLSPGHPDQQPGRHWTFVAGKLAPVERMEGTVAVISGLSNQVYFHWMLDLLPRIELLQLGGFKLEEIDYFLVSDRHPFQTASLQKLGIPKSKILPTEQHLHCSATQLIVPSFPGAVAWSQPWVCDFLKTQFLPSQQTVNSTSPRRIYISRSQTTNRRVINESAVVNLLKSFGFQSVALESLSIQEQATLFANAEAVVSPHGSGLTNLVFCQPGTRLIELFAPDFVYSCYWYLSNLVGIDYFYLLGEMPEGIDFHQLLYPNARIEDIFVNLEALKNQLEFAGIV